MILLTSASASFCQQMEPSVQLYDPVQLVTPYEANVCTQAAQAFRTKLQVLLEDLKTMPGFR